MAAVAIPFGLAIGVSLGMLGGGGSVLAMPVLVYILGQNVHQATTASLVVVTAGAVIGGLSHARDGRVCWRHAIAFIAAALPGVIAGTALGQALSGRALLAAFAVIMLAAAAATWRKATRDTTSPSAELSTTRLPRPATRPRPNSRIVGRRDDRLLRSRWRLPDRTHLGRRARPLDAHGCRHLAGHHHRHPRSWPSVPISRLAAHSTSASPSR